MVQTICDLAGVEAPGDWDGDSMLPWMDDASAGWKDLAISQYYAHNVCSGFSMIRRGPYKYVYHTRINERYGPEEELYDLDADPGEFDNLAAAEPERCAALRAEMHLAVEAPPHKTAVFTYAEGDKPFVRRIEFKNVMGVTSLEFSDVKSERIHEADFLLENAIAG